MTFSHGPKCNGTARRGENSVRATKLGVLISGSSRCTPPAKASNPKYTGTFRKGDCSTELKRACGLLRTLMLISGLVLMKLRSLSDARLKLKPWKLCVRKVELRISELIASPKVSAKARRNVSDDSSLMSATNRQLWGSSDCT